MNKLTNKELIDEWNKNRKRGGVASEMCTRAGTLKYLLKYATDNDNKFFSCMKDTIDILKKEAKLQEVLKDECNIREFSEGINTRTSN